jgi:hypothetical protein
VDLFDGGGRSRPSADFFQDLAAAPRQRERARVLAGLVQRLGIDQRDALAGMPRLTSSAASAMPAGPAPQMAMS